MRMLRSVVFLSANRHAKTSATVAMYLYAFVHGRAKVTMLCYITLAFFHEFSNCPKIMYNTVATNQQQYLWLVLIKCIYPY